MLHSVTESFQWHSLKCGVVCSFVCWFVCLHTMHYIYDVVHFHMVVS